MFVLTIVIISLIVTMTSASPIDNDKNAAASDRQENISYSYNTYPLEGYEKGSQQIGDKKFDAQDLIQKLVRASEDSKSQSIAAVGDMLQAIGQAVNHILAGIGDALTEMSKIEGEHDNYSRLKAQSGAL